MDTNLKIERQNLAREILVARAARETSTRFQRLRLMSLKYEQNKQKGLRHEAA